VQTSRLQGEKHGGRMTRNPGNLVPLRLSPKWSEVGPAPDFLLLIDLKDDACDLMIQSDKPGTWVEQQVER